MAKLSELSKKECIRDQPLNNMFQVQDSNLVVCLPDMVITFNIEKDDLNHTFSEDRISFDDHDIRILYK